MEVGKEVWHGLQISSNAEIVDDDSYIKMVNYVIWNVQGQISMLNDDDQSFTKVTEQKAIFALSSFLVDCAKQDVSHDEIRAILEESRFDGKRIQIFLDLYQKHKDCIRRKLSSISSLGRAQIVDVNWRLDYNMKNSQSDKVNQLSYLVDLHTQEPGESETKLVSFTCSLEQLQDLVGKLKDAVRCVEKQITT